MILILSKIFSRVNAKPSHKSSFKEKNIQIFFPQK